MKHISLFIILSFFFISFDSLSAEESDCGLFKSRTYLSAKENKNPTVTIAKRAVEILGVNEDHFYYNFGLTREAFEQAIAKYLATSERAQLNVDIVEVVDDFPVMGITQKFDQTTQRVRTYLVIPRRLIETDPKLYDETPEFSQRSVGDVATISLHEIRRIISTIDNERIRMVLALRYSLISDATTHTKLHSNVYY